MVDYFIIIITFMVDKARSIRTTEAQLSKITENSKPSGTDTVYFHSCNYPSVLNSRWQNLKEHQNNREMADNVKRDVVSELDRS